MNEKWAICYNILRQPTTWGRVIYESDDTIEVEYGKNAPMWFGSLWARRFTKLVSSEREAEREIVDFKNNIEYDSR